VAALLRARYGRRPTPPAECRRWGVALPRAFWAQQAAEKALKGALTYAGVPFEATHRLNALAAALPDDWETRRGRGALTELTSYGVETRYPGVGEPEPTVEDARRAITQAQAVQQVVWRDLEAHGFPFQSQQRPPQ